MHDYRIDNCTKIIVKAREVTVDLNIRDSRYPKLLKKMKKSQSNLRIIKRQLIISQNNYLMTNCLNYNCVNLVNIFPLVHYF